MSLLSLPIVMEMEMVLENGHGASIDQRRRHDTCLTHVGGKKQRPMLLKVTDVLTQTD